MCLSCRTRGFEDPITYADNKRERVEEYLNEEDGYVSHRADLHAKKRAEVAKRLKHAVETGNSEQLSKLLSEARGVNQSDTSAQAEYLLGVR